MSCSAISHIRIKRNWADTIRSDQDSGGVVAISQRKDVR